MRSIRVEKLTIKLTYSELLLIQAVLRETQIIQVGEADTKKFRDEIDFCISRIPSNINF